MYFLLILSNTRCRSNGPRGAFVSCMVSNAAGVFCLERAWGCGETNYVVRVVSFVRPTSSVFSASLFYGFYF